MSRGDWRSSQPCMPHSRLLRMADRGPPSCSGWCYELMMQNLAKRGGSGVKVKGTRFVEFPLLDQLEACRAPYKNVERISFVYHDWLNHPPLM